MGESHSYAVESVKEGFVSLWSLYKYQVGIWSGESHVVKLMTESYLS